MNLLSLMDPGLAYLKQIGFNRIRGEHGLINAWIKKYGYKKANELGEKIDKMEKGTAEFYELKNSDPYISISMSEAFDEDIIRKSCKYIADNNQYFGKTILEIGCDIGIMTGFLGLAFPESQIVAIDRCKPAVEYARERIKVLGLNNVEIRACSIEEVQETFDTVFSMRTIHENTEDDRLPFDGESFRVQCYSYMGYTEKYSKEIRKRIAPSGTLVAIERLSDDPQLVAWVNGMSVTGLGLIAGTHKRLEVREVEEEKTIHAFVFREGNKTDINQVFNEVYQTFVDIERGEKEIEDLDALVYLDKYAGKMIKGVRMFDGDGQQTGRFAAFEDKDGKELTYYLAASGGHGLKVITVSKDLTDQALENMEKQAQYNVEHGIIIKEIDPDDSDLEGNCTLFKK